MTAPVGTTAFTTKESSQSEEDHVLWISEVIRELGSDWHIRHFMSIEEIIGKKPEYALLKDGVTSQGWESDGGFIFYRNKLVGAAENKWQKARENACERACRYLTFLRGKQLFVSTAGPGFIKKNGGGATGPCIEMLRFSGACVTENVNTENEFKALFSEWVISLV